MLGLTLEEMRTNRAMIIEFMEEEASYWRFDYESDFNHIIPVCNKILKLVRDDRELYQKINLKQDAFWAYEACKNMFAISDIDGQLHIEAVYLRCIDFLRWLKTINYEAK